jgi:tellurite resistance protein
MISHHAALIYTMVFVAAADTDMTDVELRTIGDNVRGLPVFRGFDTEQLTKITAACAALLEKEDGVEEAFEHVRKALPSKLRETAYALACDVAASDGMVGPVEQQLLEMIRHRLEIDRLIAAGIERGARARFTTL